MAGDDVRPSAPPDGRAEPGPVVHYYFPVEVEIVGDVDDAVVNRVVERVFAELDREMSSRP
ncbi:hypothetical protein COUCH_15800 [Couchioplanes caeruleus]|uniref:hypothetical protein n=1 Tax=Couchioplanes caeruleus TaxID=56438 RepID=UPI0020BFB6AA|nr:hypothetical protein [Couchioplanes caeruleus]UQU67644.1 hypothetical protein COUCH_15800 [Couchioplanes caeruleus]